MKQRNTPLSPQLLLICTGLLIWLLRPYPALATLVLAYGVAWLLFNYLPGLRRGAGVDAHAGWVWTALALVAAGPLLALHQRIEDLGWEEGVRGLRQNLGHRLRLERLPALAPPTVFADHPQALYGYAPKGRSATLELAPGVEKLVGIPLGEGLFRFEYDPRQQGLPQVEAASLKARLEIDGRSHERSLRWIRWQAHPRWFTSAPAEGLGAAPSEETDEVVVVSREGLVRRIPVGDGPSDAAFLGGGARLAVGHRYGADLWVVDARTGEELERVPLGPFQVRLAVSPQGDALAVALAGESPGIEVLSLPDLVVRERIDLEQPPDALSFGPSRRTLIYSSRQERALFKVQASEDREGEARWGAPIPLRLGRPVVALASAGGGRHLYLAATDFRPDGERHRGNHFIQDQILTVAVEAWQVVGQLMTGRRTPSQTRAGNLDSGISPMGFAPREDGSLLVAFAGSDEVWELPPGLRGPPKVTAGVDLDLAAPHGVADLGEGFWAASSPGGGALAVYSPQGELLHFLPVSPSDSELDAGPAGSLARQDLRLRAGELAFYEGTRSGISCQSCHLHGGSDESPHYIGQTPLLPTLTVRGIAGTSPYLRDGSFPRVRDLNDHLAETLYRGYTRFSPSRRGDLETFAESLPRTVNPRLLEGVDPERMTRGAEAFVKARCDFCHAFPALTNLSQHPVAALFPDYAADQPPEAILDTPSLLGSHDRSHFLQDGRAHGLGEVLEEFNTANRHGDSAVLVAREREALIYFLESL